MLTRKKKKKKAFETVVDKQKHYEHGRGRGLPTSRTKAKHVNRMLSPKLGKGKLACWSILDIQGFVCMIGFLFVFVAVVLVCFFFPD